MIQRRRVREQERERKINTGTTSPFDFQFIYFPCSCPYYLFNYHLHFDCTCYMHVCVCVCMCVRGCICVIVKIPPTIGLWCYSSALCGLTLFFYFGTLGFLLLMFNNVLAHTGSQSSSKCLVSGPYLHTKIWVRPRKRIHPTSPASVSRTPGILPGDLISAFRLVRVEDGRRSLKFQSAYFHVSDSPVK